MHLTFGFSPCPNDTFMFDAIVHDRIDLRGLKIEPVLADVEELNKLAKSGTLDITKLSYNALAHLTATYQLLESGSALGRNCGPLLVMRADREIIDVASARIAIPGVNTTANLLLDVAYPQAKNRVEMLFSDIEAAVLSGEVDLGLLIHENRFTYMDRGLRKVVDLGQHWEETTGSAIPLGGIVTRRSLDTSTKRTISAVIADSVRYAMQHRAVPLPYIRQHAQEMDPAVMYSHIDLYVNDYSRNLGVEGKAAIEKLLEYAASRDTGLQITQPLYVER